MTVKNVFIHIMTKPPAVLAEAEALFGPDEALDGFAKTGQA